jgi:hypothetical protein
MTRWFPLLFAGLLLGGCGGETEASLSGTKGMIELGLKLCEESE